MESNQLKLFQAVEQPQNSFKPDTSVAQSGNFGNGDVRNLPTKAVAGMNNSLRIVMPQQQAFPASKELDSNQYSKVAAADTEFRQLIGDATEGTVARFLNNKLNLLFWYRSPSDARLIFGAQISLTQLKEGLKNVVQGLDPALRSDVAVALLDDNARPTALSQADFHTAWKHPFVATEIGEALPHWEMAVYLLDPGKLTQSVCNL